MVLNIGEFLRGAEFSMGELARRDSVPEKSPIGNWGISDVESIVKVILFTPENQGLNFISRANSWIDQGFSVKEYEWFDEPDSHRYHLMQARALGYWLENNELATNHWNDARRYLEAWWRSASYPWTRQEIVRDGLNDYMAMAVLGGHFEDYKCGKEPFEAGINMFEHLIGKQDVLFKKTLKPCEFGYALCHHYLNNEFDREELLQAGRQMLAANLETDWLENGQSIRAAMWLMLVYWYPSFHNGEDLPRPVDVLLKAYDDMPSVTRPF